MSSGIRSWRRTCEHCGQRYTLTNFMRRGLLDTHQLACRKKIEREPKTRIHETQIKEGK